MKVKAVVFTLSIFFLMTMGLNRQAYGQSMSKKYKVIEVERVLPFSAEKVWATVAVDYGKVAESHPRILRSDYEAGSLKGELGAQRMCAFNEKETQILHEKITKWDPENMTLVNSVLEAKKFPLDTDNSRGIYTVIPIDERSSKFKIRFEFRTTPAFMAGMVKGNFAKLLADYMIAIEHHIKTGEAVNRENFKDIRKQYASK